MAFLQHTFQQKLSELSVQENDVTNLLLSKITKSIFIFLDMEHCFSTSVFFEDYYCNADNH